MPDRKPPRLASDERSTLMALLQFQRESFVRNLDGLDEGQARRTVVDSGTSLLWLVKHLNRAESLWVLHRFAGHDVALDDTVTAADSVSSAIDAYRATSARVDEVLAGSPDLDETCRNEHGDPSVTLRWVLMHLLEETARHAGHADILRELIDGTTGR